MSKPIPNYLKLHDEFADQADAPISNDLPQLGLICRSLESVTGWPLRCQQVSGDRASGAWQQQAERVRIAIDVRSQENNNAAAPHHDVQQLAQAINQLVEELQATRKALWQREAELAAGVPIVRHPEEQVHLAARLEAVLRGGSEALDCQAAALYMLDETTSQLKLRASWGLPRRRLLDSARPLKGAAVDLEALVGHAVVLKDTSLLPDWQAPEDFAAAVCVPVSSPTAVLGTLWFFADTPRDFTTQQSTMAEIVAGRLAADLEREMLLLQSERSKKWEHQFSQLVDRHQQRLPNVTPLLDDWQLASWHCPASDFSGEFFDWSVMPDGRLTVAVGQADGDSLESLLAGVTLQATVKSYSESRRSSREVLDRASDTLWTMSAGDQFASLFYAIIDDRGNFEYAAAGNVGAVLCRSDSCQPLSVESSPLCSEADAGHRSFYESMQPGEVLVIFTNGLRAALEKLDDASAEETIAAVLNGMEDDSTEAIAQRIRDLVETYNPARALTDRTVLVVKRRCSSPATFE